MIAFATLFLGLVVGTHTIEVQVGDAVAAVEIRLNGRPVGRIEGEPWAIDCDFGSELMPQLLEARAYDAERREIARTEQVINLPHPPAAVSFVVDTDDRTGIPVARLAWESRVGEAPRSVSAWFDGEPLPVGDPGHIVLPPHDRDRLHLFSAELTFSDHVVSQVMGTFGGTFADQVSTELTAVPIVVEGKRKPPPLEAMRGWFLKNGRLIAPVIVEKGRSDIVLVAGSPLSERSESAWRVRNALPLRDGQVLRMLQPFVETTPGAHTTFNLYPMSPDYDFRSGGLYWLLTRVRYHGPLAGSRRIADAVAVAGLAAYERSPRRVVILLYDGEGEDASDLTAAQSRRYLERLHVPFVLWTPRRGEAEIAGWGTPTSVASFNRLGAAFDQLNKRMNRQWIVWLEGRHLPQEITLAAEAEGVALASTPGPL